MYDDDDDEYDDHEDEVESAREEAFEAGKEEGSGASFGCGCLTGILLTLAAIYFGWCHPYVA